MLRVAAAVLLCLGVAGCDWGEEIRPDTFTLTITGDVQRTISGTHGYTRLTRYSGIGTGNSYGIALRSVPVDPGSSPFYEWPPPDSVRSLLLFFGEAAVPRGTYSTDGGRFFSARFWLDGELHVAHAGAVTFEPGFGRLAGTFHLADVYRVVEGPEGGPVEIEVEGSFDIARDEL